MSLACNRTEQESHRIVSLELREEVNLNVLKNANPNISMTQKKKKRSTNILVKQRTKWQENINNEK